MFSQTFDNESEDDEEKHNHEYETPIVQSSHQHIEGK